MTPRSNRRTFLGSMAAAPAVAAVPLTRGVFGLERADDEPKAAPAAGPNDRVRIATIGMGIIGFIDTDTALKVPGVELVAVSDVYEGRRARVKEVYGDHVATTVDYREVLAREDVDAVLLCVPDHWHAPMSIEAMRAGKAVYCEKPMVRAVAEGPEVMAVARETKAVFQVGSQYASSMLYEKVRQIVQSGAIGKVNSIEARYNRNSSTGAWQYSIPLDASPQTVDWDRFLGAAPQRPFDAVRAFRWRNYWDYGTAVAGDLFVHLLTGIHHVTASHGPNRVAAMGGLRYWNDGRDVYDLIMALLDYPETKAHAAFTVALQCNFEDGGGGDALFRFVGSDGAISVTFTEATLTRVGIVEPTVEQLLKGYNSVKTFSAAQREAIAAKLRAETRAVPPKADPKPETFRVPAGYDERLDHMKNFFRSVREGTPVYEDATFGFRAAAPALLCNDSYREGKVFGWDPEAMKTV
jgi:predicted dehydrogenase